MLPTIFIALPSMYDTELIHTVLNAFQAAKHPERITLGVSLMDDSKLLLNQLKKHTKQYESQIRLKFTKISSKNALDFIGVGKGRKLASSLYEDEDFMLQCDSHTYFDTDWDESLIELFNRAKTELGFEKFILTAYAGRYRYTPDGERKPIDGEEAPRFPYYVKTARLSNYTPSWEDHPLDVNGFYPCTKFNANFAFGDKQFATNTGVFEDAVFFEEEPVQSINLREAGFKLVFPAMDKSIIYHLYAYVDEGNTGFGFRRTGYSYLTPKQMEFINYKNWEVWKSYVFDPFNFDKVRRYERYSGTSLRYGVFKENYIPTDY